MALENSLLIFLMTIFLAAISSIVIQTLVNGISPMPSNQKVCSEMIKVTAEIVKPTHIIDLGSGWGNLSFAFAKAFPQAKVIGYENSLIPYLFTICLNLILRRTNLRFCYHNFLKVPFKEANLIVCYLFPGGMKRLKPKFEQELKPGAVVVSNTFALPGKQPFKIVKVKDIYLSKLYFYKF